MRIPLFAASLAVLAMASGCNRAADEQRKADEARAEANDKISEARREAQLKINAARTDANEQISEANAGFEKLRTDYRHDMDDKLASLDKDIAKLEDKAASATSKTKVELQQKLPAVRSQRQAFAAEYRSLDTASAATWDDTKERVDKSWQQLKKAVDDAD